MPRHFAISPAALELLRAGTTATAVAQALGRTPSAVSMMLAGRRRLDVRLPAVVAALTDRATADRVEQLATEARR